MVALLDEGDNHIVVLRGRDVGPEQYADIILSVQVNQLPAATEPESDEDHADRHGEGLAGNHASEVLDRDAALTAAAPTLEPRSREWYVALALAEPWLTGSDDYPRPPSNREIYERVLAW